MIFFNFNNPTLQIIILLFVIIGSGVHSYTQNVFVSSRNTHSIKRYDFVTGNYLGDFISPGSGGLSFPQEVIWHPDGFLLVTARGNSAIKKYDGETGAYLGNFTTGYALDNPTKTTIWKDSLIYVSQWSTTNNKVVRFNLKTGAFVDEFTSIGLPNGGGHAWDDTGNLLVAQYGDGLNGSVLKFDTNGNFLGTFIPTGQVRGPINVWFDATGTLYVADWILGDVLAFDGKTGAFKSTLITSLKNVEGFDFDSQGNLYLCDWTDNKIYRYNFTTNTLSLFTQSGGMVAPNSILIREALISSANQVDLSDKVAIQVLPNPANNLVQFSIQIKENITGKLFIINATGQKIATISEGTLESGNHILPFNTENLPNGTFHYVFATGKGQLSGTFLLQR